MIVERFCMGSRGFHDSIIVPGKVRVKSCLFTLPAYGPPGQALVAPNATNPFKTGYFQGDALAPLESIAACLGLFGAGAYAGLPGDLKADKVSKASYNAYGARGSKFLLPAIWLPVSLDCKIAV
ncbi:hypothetical protein CUMW_056130 [Citrus unshiu]|nr:hypothetical protein CUMW_056130 [Citrus unshiu]